MRATGAFQHVSDGRCPSFQRGCPFACSISLKKEEQRRFETLLIEALHQICERLLYLLMLSTLSEFWPNRGFCKPYGPALELNRSAVRSRSGDVGIILSLSYRFYLDLSAAGLQLGTGYLSWLIDAGVEVIETSIG